MEETGEPSLRAPGDRGSSRRRVRTEKAQYGDGQDLHSLTDERASENTQSLWLEHQPSA